MMYWLILVSIVLITIRFRISSQKWLYLGLKIIILGALFDVFGFRFAEQILNIGFLALLSGTAIALVKSRHVT